MDDDYGQEKSHQFYTNDQLDMPQQMPTEFKNEIIQMICTNGRQAFIGQEADLTEFADDEISLFD
jgi:hypothetical protein